MKTIENKDLDRICGKDLTLSEDEYYVKNWF
jgi:hypothetical protein